MAKGATKGRKKAGQKADASDRETCPTCKRRHHDGAAAMLEQMLEKVSDQLARAEVKPTIGEYLRLLQFREEIRDDEQPKEIRVTWVEPMERSEGEE
jgi:hypothetical protein